MILTLSPRFGTQSRDARASTIVRCATACDPRCNMKLITGDAITANTTNSDDSEFKNFILKLVVITISCDGESRIQITAVKYCRCDNGHFNHCILAFIYHSSINYPKSKFRWTNTIWCHRWSFPHDIKDTISEMLQSLIS